MRIELREVSKRFGERVILDRISTTIESGQTVALIGPSGSGKSTLLRCLNALNSFDAGAIRVASSELQPAARHRLHAPGVQEVRRMLGMIFQDFQLFPHLTALQNVMEAPRHVLRLPSARAEAQATELLQRVGLGERLHYYPRQLSGGQKQRVAIARALAMEPRGLLCDEITSALDPALKHEVLSVLESLKRDGLTLIMVTHEIGFARRAADRVLMLHSGQIIEDGPPQQVLEQPRDPRTQQFLRNILN